MSSSLNYYQPHKRRILFWLTQISFALTAQKYVMAMTLVTVKDDPVRLQQIEFILITLDLYVDQKIKSTFCSDVLFGCSFFSDVFFSDVSFLMFSFHHFLQNIHVVRLHLHCFDHCIVEVGDAQRLWDGKIIDENHEQCKLGRHQ